MKENPALTYTEAHELAIKKLSDKKQAEGQPRHTGKEKLR